MSARVPVGATNRSDLFGGTGRQNVEDKSAEREDVESDDRRDDDPMQLEHMLGYAGDFRGTVITSPKDENLYVRSMGCLVSIEDLNDPHNQKLLRGHDMTVSAIAVSGSGRLLASGQAGTKSYKGNAAPIFVWNTDSLQKILTLKGLSNKVNLISFSTDECYLCGCGEDSLLYIWDLVSGEVILAQRLLSPASLLTWVEHFRDGRRISYELIVGIGSSLNQCILSFDPTRVQWSLKMQPFALPSGGLIRYYTCIDLSPGKHMVYVGTTGGDLIVYRRDSTVFRACIPVSSNGVQSIVALSDGDILCGGGDGVIKKLRGEDLDWQVIQEVSLDGAVLSLSLSRNGLELIAGCSSSTIYRVSTQDFADVISCSGHTSSVTSLAFGNSTSFFVTGTRLGELRVWDIGDYACQSVTKLPKAGAVNSVCVLDSDSVNSNPTIISGWEDGSIHCHDMTNLNRQIWVIGSAHRGGTLTVAAHSGPALEYLISGGADHAVRVWRLSNRSMIVQFGEHTKIVTKVLVDNTQPHLVHSVSLDNSILTYDIRTQRRISGHFLNKGGGQLLAMTQRRDSELELVTCDSQGRLLMWDCDVPDAVQSLQDPSRCPLKCCIVSPSGRFMAFAGDDHKLKVLNMQNTEVVSVGIGHSDSINTIAWTPDEQQLITGGDDFCVCVWNFFLSA